MTMKTLMKLCLALMLMLSTSIASMAQQTETKGIATVVFTSDIDCDHCKQKIEKNIPFEKGVKDLVVSLADKTVTITYRTDKNTAENLCVALNKLGYKSEIKERR